MLFEPKEWNLNEIDIFIPPQSVSSFVDTIIANIGIVNMKSVEEAFYDPIETDFMAVTFIDMGTTVLKLAHTSHPVASVSFCSSTLLWNYMAWDHLCIGYPRYTLKKEGLVFILLHSNYLTVMQYPQDTVKYANRGFLMYHITNTIQCGTTDVYQLPYTGQEIMDWGDTQCTNPMVCPKSGREFGDAMCKVIAFTPTIRYPVETLAWQLGGYGCGDKCITWKNWVIEVVKPSEDCYQFIRSNS